MVAGRPSIFTQEMADEICGRIACGISLKRIVQDDAMPCERTVYGWLRENEKFLQQYTQARLEQADATADNIDKIAQDVLDGLVDPNAARVAIDAYKWSAGKRNAKKYGDSVKHTGDPANPIQIIQRRIVDDSGDTNS